MDGGGGGSAGAGDGTGMVNGKQEPRMLRHASVKDEDAAELELGPEFSGEQSQPLFLAEAAQLLRVKLENDPMEEAEMNSVLKKSLQHLERFDHIQGQEAAVDVRRLLENAPIEGSLHAFEITQLASLVPKDAEEAKAIIPSLKKSFEDDAKLNDLLKSLDNFVRS